MAQTKTNMLLNPRNATTRTNQKQRNKPQPSVALFLLSYKPQAIKIQQATIKPPTPRSLLINQKTATNPQTNPQHKSTNN